MNGPNTQYVRQTLTIDGVLKLLQMCDKEFTPSLSAFIHLKQYAEKLASNAHFILAQDKDKVIGFIAYYLNVEGKFVYVPLIWVSSLYQRHGIGKDLLSQLSQSISTDYETIRLEVIKNNAAAVNFYKHEGFKMGEDRDTKWLIEKTLN